MTASIVAGDMIAGRSRRPRDAQTQKVSMSKARAVDFRHRCAWRRAAILLAQCVIATLQTDGKIGMGSGLVMKTVDGKKIVERWDKDFIAALAFIGIEVGERSAKKKIKARRAPSRQPR